MTVKIPPQHPITRLFNQGLELSFKYQPNIYRPEVKEYLLNEILLRFLHVDNLYKIKTLTGRVISDVGELLLEGEILANASSFEREKEVHRHIGDFILFMAGFFPESLKKIKINSPTGLILHLKSLYIVFNDPFDFYLMQGKESYKKVSLIEKGLNYKLYKLYDILSSRFQLYIGVLSLTKSFIENTDFFKDISKIIN